MKKWLTRIGLGVLGLIVVAVTAGAIFEQWARAHVQRDFPPPGKLVDIGGRHLQIDCRGSGAPTVVLESGGDPFGATDWGKVQDQIARTSRVCSYSRAGIMWSDPADGPRSGKEAVADLHMLLQKAGERPPFVLTGWSLGGPYMVLYTQHYGAEVAGLVLVDPAHPNQAREVEAITRRPERFIPPVAKVAAKLTWNGLVRLLAPLDMSPTRVAFLPTSLPAAQKEVASIGETFAAVAATHDLGNRPLIVLTGMASYSPQALQEIGMTREEGERFKRAWRRLHDDMATWSTAGRNELISDASHNMPEQDPQAVIRAVNAVVARVRNR